MTTTKNANTANTAPLITRAEHMKRNKAVFQANGDSWSEHKLYYAQFVTEETVLHYNGMLKSTWDVLTESQNQIQASAAAVNAQRDFAIAKIDLEWVLLGGEPTGFITLGGGDAAPAAGQ